MDVRKGPLARADEHIEEYRHDVGDAAISIETRLSNGLEKLQAKEADTVIIAGMGGELEISILEAGQQLWSSIRHWIFSPQSDLEKFRRYLKENGFFIENEAMILDEGKFYTVIKAGFGTNEKDACVCETVPEYRFGALLIKRRDAVLKQYLLKEEKRVEGILKGFAGKSEEELTAGQAAACKALKEELSCIREAQDEMQ